MRVPQSDNGTSNIKLMRKPAFAARSEFRSLPLWIIRLIKMKFLMRPMLVPNSATQIVHDAAILSVVSIYCWPAQSGRATRWAPPTKPGHRPSAGVRSARQAPGPEAKDHHNPSRMDNGLVTLVANGGAGGKAGTRQLPTPPGPPPCAAQATGARPPRGPRTAQGPQEFLGPSRHPLCRLN